MADRLNERRVPAEDSFDERHHPCGCHTVFDKAPMRSVALKRCPEHAALVAAHGGNLDG